ncbi:MAG: AAA family ATPase [Cyanobacteria bacterium]|nr:AAA family ATPase [Cyanobacteriota bacterium]
MEPTQLNIKEPLQAISPFQQKLANLLKANFPLIYITTWEEERLLEIVQILNQNPALLKKQRKIYTWSATTGLLGGNETFQEESKTLQKALDRIESIPEASIIILKDLHVYFGHGNRPTDTGIVRKLRDLAVVLKSGEKAKSLILVAPSLILPTELQKDVYVLDLELPTFEEIQTLLNEMIEANQDRSAIEVTLSLDEKEKLIKAAQGLTLQEVENTLAHAMVNDGKLTIQDLNLIIQEKCQIIKKTGLLEYIQTDLNLEDVGGLNHLKLWLKKRNKSWLEAAQQYGLSAPKGVLITGVPGCGKSLVAKAISSIWTLPLLRLDIGSIFSGLVGSSEENIRKAIKTAEAISPSILWIDEIEKGFSGVGSTGDSGTSSRVFGTFLTWMQEKTHPVFVIATANNINALPPEMMRKGRFDEIFFVDLPDAGERRDIFLLHLKKRLKHPKAIGNFKLTPDMLNTLVSKSEGFIGAEIEEVVVSALFEAFSENRGILFEDLMKAVEETVPLSMTQAEQIASLREWAKMRAVSASHIQAKAFQGNEFHPNQPEGEASHHVHHP